MCWEGASVRRPVAFMFFGPSVVIASFSLSTHMVLRERTWPSRFDEELESGPSSSVQGVEQQARQQLRKEERRLRRHVLPLLCDVPHLLHGRGSHHEGH